MKRLKNLLKREKGVTTVEWLIIIAAVAVLATVAVGALKGPIENLTKKAVDSISDGETAYEDADGGDADSGDADGGDADSGDADGGDADGGENS